MFTEDLKVSALHEVVVIQKVQTVFSSSSIIEVINLATMEVFLGLSD